MSEHESLFNTITSRLDTLRKRQKRLSLTEGVVVFLLLALGVSLLAVASETIFHMSPISRTIFLGSTLFILTVAFSALVLRPLRTLFFRPHFPDDITLALIVGEKFNVIRDRLADALQVFKRRQKNPEGYSLELADAALFDINNDLQKLDLDSVADSGRLKERAKLLGVSLLAFAAIFAIFFSGFSNASYRLLHPRKDFIARPLVRIEVSPGNAQVVKGEHVAVKVSIKSDKAFDVGLLVKAAGAKDFSRYDSKSAVNGEVSFTIESVRDDLDYFVEAPPYKSDEFTLSVIEMPFVRNLQVRLSYPAYSKLGSHFLDENVGDFSALKGTRVELRAQINKSVTDAKIIFDNDREKAMKISGKELIGRHRIMKSGTYRLQLQDSEGLTNDAAIEYRMTVIDDQAPLVQVTFPGQDVDLGEDMMLPLSIEAEDDFGFSKTRIGYRVLKGGAQEGDQQFFEIALPEEVNDKMLLNHTWDLSSTGIFPEDVIEYYAEVFDNDKVSGPKSSRSLTYRVRFPSLHEIYEEVARGHEESYESLEDLVEQSKTLRENLKDIVQEMKREPELNWEEKQKVQESLQAQQKMQEELQSVQEKLDDMISRMEQNDLLSMETMQKYRELQQLMEEIMTPEMKEALKEMQKSLDELDPKKLKEAMEKFAASQEDFLKSMERTLNLLKKLHIEQQLDEAVRRAQDLLRRQKELNQQAAQAPQKQKANKYAQEQKGIQKDTENLSELLKDLKKKMGEFPRMPQQRIEAAQKQAGENGLQSQMQQSMQQFQSGDMQGAQSSIQQTSQGLQELLETLQTAQKELSEGQKQEIMQALNRASHNLLNLSKQQENLMQSTQRMDRNSPGMNEAADQQQNLLSGLQRVANELMEASQQTFFVTPEIGKALGKSMGGMQSSLDNLEARNSGKSGQNQGKAMSGLNEAVSELRKSMQQMSGASSGIGFQEMMQRLMGMSGKQQGLNKQTSQLGQKPGALSMQQQAAMARLAAEQEALRKSLQQLMKEAGNRSDILGDLGKVGKDMEDVVKELQKKNVNRNTIQRQKRILSRLLDAQRSMHDRDYSKKRKAETGNQYHALSPQALPAKVLTKRDRLKNELLKAMKEGYSKDYRELIRKYFEALYEEQQKEASNH